MNFATRGGFNFNSFSFFKIIIFNGRSDEPAANNESSRPAMVLSIRVFGLWVRNFRVRFLYDCTRRFAGREAQVVRCR